MWAVGFGMFRTATIKTKFTIFFSHAFKTFAFSIITNKTFHFHLEICFQPPLFNREFFSVASNTAMLCWNTGEFKQTSHFPQSKLWIPTLLQSADMRQPLSKFNQSYNDRKVPHLVNDESFSQDIRPFVRNWIQDCLSVVEYLFNKSSSNLGGIYKTPLFGITS